MFLWNIPNLGICCLYNGLGRTRFRFSISVTSIPAQVLKFAIDAVIEKRIKIASFTLVVDIIKYLTNFYKARAHIKHFKEIRWDGNKLIMRKFSHKPENRLRVVLIYVV